MMKRTFDYNQAIEVLQGINEVSKLGATLFVPDSELDHVAVLFSVDGCKGRCPHCVSTEDDASDLWTPSCQRVHNTAAHFADRFGGRYFYLCKEDRIFFVAPIIADGGLAAAATIGPVHIFEVEDNQIDRPDLKPFPVRTPAYVHHLSTLLSAGAMCVSDSSQTNLLAIRKANLEQQGRIHVAIENNKKRQFSEYPITLEENLFAAIEKGDSATARVLLNDILGVLLSSQYVGNGYSICDRTIEMLTMCSRAALHVGVKSELVFEVVLRYREEMRRLNTSEQLCNCLQRAVEHLVFLVRRLKEMGYEDDIYRAVEYIRRNYREKLSLDAVAAEIGYSPTYFSRRFKERLGVSFSDYLNTVRIDVSKGSLLSTDLPIATVAQQSGFEDVSYFSHVFKRKTGVRPGYYRSHRGAIDHAKEHGE